MVTNDNLIDHNHRYKKQPAQKVFDKNTRFKFNATASLLKEKARRLIKRAKTTIGLSPDTYRSRTSAGVVHPSIPRDYYPFEVLETFDQKGFFDQTYH